MLSFVFFGDSIRNKTLFPFFQPRKTAASLKKHCKTHPDNLLAWQQQRRKAWHCTIPASMR
jgi:hypothetical protein